MMTCLSALLLFAACDSETMFEAVAEPSFSVIADAPAYALTPTSVNLKIDEYFRFQPILTNGSDTKVSDVTYTTSNASVMTVNTYGTVRGRANGTAMLTATSSTYGTSTAIVKVGTAAIPQSTNVPSTTATTKPEMKTIALTPAAVTLAAGATAQLSAVAKDQYGAVVSGVTFTWTSPNPAVATVSPTGLVTGVAAGQVSIKATSGAISGAAAVTVSGTATAVTQVATAMAVTPASATVAASATQQLTATVQEQSGNRMTGVALSWASANPAIATVSTTGLVRGVASGQVAVAATGGGVTGSAMITVTGSTTTSSTTTTTALPPTTGGTGIWISQQEIMALPTSGTAWSNVKANADRACGIPNLANQDDLVNVCVLAKALVYARTGGASYRDGVLAALRSIATSGAYVGRALALGRELPAYVIAADVINLKTLDPTLDTQFRAKIRELRNTPTIDGPASLADCHDKRPNNWGTWCGTARVAVDLYIADRADFDKAVLVMRGWLGDRTAYTGFAWSGDLSWQVDPTRPVAVQPRGATKNGYNIDGVLAEEMRRCGSFQWPPCVTTYTWGATEGAIVTLYMMHRQGLPALEWSNRALLRAYAWLHGPGNDPAKGNDEWQPYLVNYLYGTSFPTIAPADPGKNMGWTDWTHAKR
jgi:hypothetical protein